jgi:hypothetical protein
VGDAVTEWRLGNYLGWGDQGESLAFFAARVERDVLRHHDRLRRRLRLGSRQQRLRLRRRRLGLCLDCALSRQVPAVRAGYCAEHYERMAARRRKHEASNR